jgi:hypothetical protein
MGNSVLAQLGRVRLSWERSKIHLVPIQTGAKGAITFLISKNLLLSLLILTTATLSGCSSQFEDRHAAAKPATRNDSAPMIHTHITFSDQEKALGCHLEQLTSMSCFSESHALSKATCFGARVDICLLQLWPV